MESEFHATLPGNSSMQYFPDNKTSNFVTKLSRTLQLDGEPQGAVTPILGHIRDVRPELVSFPARKPADGS